MNQISSLKEKELDEESLSFINQIKIRFPELKLNENELHEDALKVIEQVKAHRPELEFDEKKLYEDAISNIIRIKIQFRIFELNEKELYEEAISLLKHGKTKLLVGVKHNRYYQNRTNEWLSNEATKGDNKAQNILGARYDEGYKIKMNKIEALRLYLCAATQGNRRALFNIARFFEYGDVVKKDRKIAMEFYTFAYDVSGGTYQHAKEKARMLKYNLDRWFLFFLSLLAFFIIYAYV